MKKLLLLLSILLLVSCSIDREDKEVYVPQDGYNSLIKQSTEGNCIIIESGLDTDRDNELQSSEITFTNMVCAIQGNDGINSVFDVERKDKCITVSSGLDYNRNGILDDDEIQSSETICAETGDPGEDGKNSLIKIEKIEKGQICEFGGIYVYIGLDDNRNNILDNDEIDSETKICNEKCIHETECIDTIVDTEPCDGGNPYVIWLSGDKLTNESLRFTFDGTNAYLYGIVVADNGQKCLIDFTLYDQTSENDNPKEHNCLDEDTSDWIYWEDVTGTITEIGGNWEATITKRGPKPQYGLNSNPTESRELIGLSFWFYYEVNGVTKNGDVNISYICE